MVLNKDGYFERIWLRNYSTGCFKFSGVEQHFNSPCIITKMAVLNNILDMPVEINPFIYILQKKSLHLDQKLKNYNTSKLPIYLRVAFFLHLSVISTII